MIFGGAQFGIFVLLAYGAFIVEVWALIDALRYSNEAYYSAGKRNKALWTTILGAAATIGFLGLPWPLGVPLTGVLDLPGLAALVAAIIYLATVRKAVAEHHRPRGPRGPRDNRGGW